MNTPSAHEKYALIPTKEEYESNVVALEKMWYRLDIVLSFPILVDKYLVWEDWWKILRKYDWDYAIFMLRNCNMEHKTVQNNVQNRVIVHTSAMSRPPIIQRVVSMVQSFL